MNTISAGRAAHYLNLQATVSRPAKAAERPLDRFDAGPQLATEPLLPKPTDAPPPGKVSWFHRLTGGAAGFAAGGLLAIVAIGGPLAAGLGAVVGLVGGVMVAGKEHSTAALTAPFHKLCAGASGLLVGGLAGLSVGDLMYHAALHSNQAHVGGALIGAGLGALALTVAARHFPDKPAKA